MNQAFMRLCCNPCLTAVPSAWRDSFKVFSPTCNAYATIHPSCWSSIKTFLNILPY